MIISPATVKADRRFSLFVMLLLHIQFGIILALEICLFTAIAGYALCRSICTRAIASDSGTVSEIGRTAGSNTQVFVRTGNQTEVVSNADNRSKTPKLQNNI